ncbi:MAG: AEC family transporter [Oscillospiraceae bacterium]|nr:AEC family transporter [Oscillospiraceae bacterium]
MTAANLAIQLVLLVGIGFLTVRCRIVGQNFEKQLTALILDILMPCMIIKSMMGTFSWEQLKNCGRLLVIAVAIWGITFGIGQLVYCLTGKKASGRIMRFSIMYTNFTFVGIPVMEALYGDVGVFYFVVFLVPYRIIYYSSAEPFLSPPGAVRTERTLKEKLRGWFSAPVIAVFVGMMLYLTQMRLPGPVSDVISSLGACASPLGMLLCGMSLGKYPIRRLLRPGYLWFPLVRNMLIPALFLGLSLLIGLEKELAQVVIMFAALPVASLLAAFMIQYDPDKEAQFEAAAAVLLSTIFAAVTIPLWSSIVAVCFP